MDFDFMPKGMMNDDGSADDDDDDFRLICRKMKTERTVESSDPHEMFDNL